MEKQTCPDCGAELKAEILGGLCPQCVLGKVIDVDAEARYALEPADPCSPDKAFERNWALTIMEQALGKLSIEQAKSGKAALFEALQSCLMKDPDGPSYSELAGKLGMSQEALRMAASRLRRRYRKLLYQEVEQTVATPGEAEEEIRHLFAALAN